MFDATDKFLTSGSEITLLMTLYNTRAEKELFFKTMIIFLSTNIEVFAEEILEEYLYKLTLLSPYSTDVDEKLIYETLSAIINESLINKVKQHKQNAKSDIIEASRYLQDYLPIEEFKICTKFNYGKHGEKEFEKLFKRVNLDVFDSCKLYKTEESYLSDDVEFVEVDLKNNIGTLTRVRNLLLHENKISTEIDITSFNIIFGNFNDFVVKIDEKLSEMLEEVRLKVALRPR